MKIGATGTAGTERGPSQKIDSEGRLTFGKHRGEHVEDVPTDYLEWVINNVTLSNDDAEVVQTALRFRQ